MPSNARRSALESLLQSPVGRWLPFLACLAAVLYALFRPEPPAQVFTESDKVGHFIAFAALGLTGRFALRLQAASRLAVAVFWGALLLFAVSSEYLQHALRPLRSFSEADVLANLVGVVLGLGAWWLWLSCARLLKPKKAC